MPRSRRQRFVIVFLLTALLLFQQLAMSALACTMPQASAKVASVSMDSAMSSSMSSAMTPECRAVMAAQYPAAAMDTLCDKHCAPEATLASTSTIPPVPALALPPLTPIAVFATATLGSDYRSAEFLARSDPPARLRYCCLLI